MSNDKGLCTCAQISRGQPEDEGSIQSHPETIYEALGRETVHPFPARMAPGIALQVISEEDAPLRVLDPMMGSGTVLALARVAGHRAVGFDIDPLAVLISKVWTTPIVPDLVRDKAEEVLARARHSLSSLAVRNAYPSLADKETRQFIRYWFDSYARRQLTALSIAIERVQDQVVRDVLWCAFSRLIIAKQSGASLAMDLPHSRPHRAFDRAPAKPFHKFPAAVERVVTNCIDSDRMAPGPASCAHLGDARDLPLPEASIDLVLTSPPYLNAIDYLRCSKFSLVWMGHSIGDLRRRRTESVGSEAGNPNLRDNKMVCDVLANLRLEPRLASNKEAILARYIYDMRLAVREADRVLSPGGKAVYVIGENTVKGTYIRNSAIVTAAAELSGLKLCGQRVRALPANRRYLPPPSTGGDSAALDARMRREVVLTFAKPAM